MIVHDVQQGSAEWLAVRAGIPSASCFDSILTPSGNLSKSAEGYMQKLIAERILGKPLVEHVTMWMERGTELEAEAAEYYQFQRDCDTYRVGFITDDSGRYGASPDRLVGDEGLLEIKAASPQVHVGYLLCSVGASKAYKVQLQGQLMVTGRKWVDILAFHPEMPPAIYRVERDEPYIETLLNAVSVFADELDRLTAMLAGRGFIKPKQEPPPEPTVEEFLGFTVSDFLEGKMRPV